MIAELFSNTLKQAAERQLPVPALFGVASQLQAAGEMRLVEALYQTWLQHNRDSALVQAVYFNFGVVLSSLGQIDAARDAFDEAIKIAPDFYPPYINLGGQLERAGKIGDAVNTWTSVANRLGLITGENIGFKTSALKQIGRVLEHAYFDPQAEDALRLSLDVNPLRPTSCSTLSVCGSGSANGPSSSPGRKSTARSCSRESPPYRWRPTPTTPCTSSGMPTPTPATRSAARQPRLSSIMRR
jgi:predicted O-linked N-acetylglucosamine transferase (SPINDLY family)